MLSFLKKSPSQKKLKHRTACQNRAWQSNDLLSPRLEAVDWRGAEVQVLEGMSPSPERMKIRQMAPIEANNLG